MDRIRVKYTKGRDVRYISHLDLMRALERALRRAEIPFALTEGFNPKPKMNFSPPLSLGYVSCAEYFDVDFTTDMPPETFISKMNDVFPVGIGITEAVKIDRASKSLNSIINGARYVIRYPFGSDIADRAGEFLNNEIIIEKKSKRGVKTVDIKPLIYDFSVKGEDTIETWLPAGSTESINPMYVLKAYLDFAGGEFREEGAFITRTEQYIDRDGNTPMQAGVCA